MERFKQLADLYLQKSQDARKYCDDAALARAIAFEQAHDMLTNVISGTAWVSRVESGWLVMVGDHPHTMHDERSCDYAQDNALSQAIEINGT